MFDGAGECFTKPCQKSKPCSCAKFCSYNQPPRVKSIIPRDCARIFGAEIPRPCTIYNLSYLPSKPARAQPIKPSPNILPIQAPLECCTVYKLSYQPNALKRTLPILPANNQFRTSMPMSRITTQKHDFTAKPYSKPLPIIRLQNLPRLIGQAEHCTINRLSYMPIDVSKFGRAKPLRPAESPKCLPPLSSYTTYKLSYMPQSIIPKEIFPWQQRPRYCRPSLPLECLTIQKLSYMPPGGVGGNCSCSCEYNNGIPRFPRAEVC